MAVSAMEDQEGAQEFLWYDYLIFVVTLLGALGIGIYHGLVGNRNTTTKSYLMADRSLSIVPVALSMFMSYISAILVLGNTAEMYTYGPTQWFSAIGSSIAYGLSALIFVPLFFPLKITSSFEYLELRFQSRLVKIIGTILLMLSQVLYMGIAMFSPATALEAATPIPVWASIVATGVIGTIYTSIGGMKAVVWTDVFQGLIMFAGVIAVLIVGFDKAGGWSEVWSIAEKGGRMDVEWTMDPFVRMSFWSVLVGRVISSLQTTGTGQTSVQRYCAMKTKREAMWAVALNIPLLAVVYSLTCLCGFAVYAYYESINCDVLRTPLVANRNQLLPYFIMNVLKVPALPGLFVAVLFSGALSSVSSSMNSLSAVTWKDLMEPYMPKMSESRQSLITKLLAAGYGCLAIGFAFVVSTVDDNVLKISNSFVSGVAGPSLGLFMLGAFFPWANWIGAVIGALSGLGFSLIVIIGETIENPYRAYLPMTTANCTDLGNFGPEDISPMPTDPDGIFIMFRMSFFWFPAFGTAICVLVGLIASLIASAVSKEPIQKEVHPSLFIPFFDRVFCCLPQSFRRLCYCDVDYDSIEVDENGVLISPPLPRLQTAVEPALEAEESQNGDITKQNGAKKGVFTVQNGVHDQVDEKKSITKEGNTGKEKSETNEKSGGGGKQEIEENGGVERNGIEEGFDNRAFEGPHTDVYYF